ncbi:lipopolysaccharide biosynthesis protein [Lewinella sp. LCG006]|uniref:lipopolysaccharide biosynthesis protein n=1 Tax=Lewinella sp. LCG006 TaxID=3231911 RepID=UPI00345FE8DD
MGVIKRQGIKAGIWMYAGVILGFVNGILLFPRILGPEVYGFVQWLFSVTGVLATVGSLGMRSGLVRYFPFFRSAENKHYGFLGFSLLIAHVGLLLLLLLLWLGQGYFFEFFESPENATYLKSSYWLLPLLLIFLVIFDILSSYLMALLRPSVMLFLRDLLSRVITTGLIVWFYFGGLTVDAFLFLFVAKQVILIFGAYVYLKRMGEWHLKIDWTAYPRERLREIGNYNAFNILTGLGGQLVNRIDSIMIPALISFEMNGIYSLFYFVTTIIIMPYEAVRQIITPLIAEAWKDNDLVQIQDLYQRTARGAFAIGLLIFIGIVANLDNAVLLIGAEYAIGTNVAIWLGIGQLIYCMNGYNLAILTLSDQFRWDLLIKLSAVMLNAVTNYLFIIAFGITGAAIATASTICVSNFIYQGLIWKYFKMQPFTKQMVGITLLGGVVYVLQLLVPPLPPHFLVDLGVRSLLILVLFSAGILVFKLVPEANEIWQQGPWRIKK